MAQEKKNVERSKLLDQRFSDAFDYTVILISTVVLLLLKWDRTVCLWLGKLFSHIPLLKLIPQNTYTLIPQILDTALFIIVVWSVWSLLVCLGGTIGDIIKTSILKKAHRYWNWFFFSLKFCILVIFLRVSITPDLYRLLWLRKLGAYVYSLGFIDVFGPTLLDFADSLLILFQIGLQAAVCFTGILFLLALAALCFSSLRELRQNPKIPKQPKAPKQPRQKIRKGASGLRKDVAEEADSRLMEFLSSQEPPEEEDSLLRVQISDPREIDRDRLLRWNDRHEIYLRVANYELVFLRQDGKAYLLGSEQLELRPNVPEVIWVEGRTKSQKLVLTYIV